MKPFDIKALRMSDEVVVSMKWVADHLDDVCLVDVREPWEYDGIGHLPGAVNIPFDSFRDAAAGPVGTLPTAEDWASLLGNAGIGPRDRLVAYDDMHGVFAARFLVTAFQYSHTSVQLLNGDYSAWVQTYETTTDTVPRSSVAYPTPSLDTTLLVSADEVAAAIDAPNTVLVDTRTGEEYVDGHIETAVQLDWVTFVDDDTRTLKSREEITAILADKGITPDKRVVLYCNTARRISHTYVILKWIGYEDVDFYEGSLTEWEAAGQPIVTE